MQKIPDIEQGPITVDTIYDLVGSAMNIPSVSIGQPTQFVVLNEVEALSRASPISAPEATVIFSAPTTRTKRDLPDAISLMPWWIAAEPVAQVAVRR